jgi:hypothetical protein
MSNNNTNDLANRISDFPNDKLIAMISANASDYTAEAIELARLEIEKRGGLNLISNQNVETPIADDSAQKSILDSNEAKTQINKIKSKPFYWLLWWKIDKDELDSQVAGYNSLGILSARGISSALLVFSAIVTMVFIVVFKDNSASYFEVIIALLLGYFVYKGQLWAIISAMIFWSFEKFVKTYVGLQDVTHSNTAVVHLLWWALYMHAFYLSYKVEQQRKIIRQNQKESHTTPEQN